MTQPSAAIRDLAAQILAQEGRVENGNIPAGSPAIAAFEKLRMHLAKFIGLAGYHALLARAFALATVDVPWLANVRLKTDGSLEVPGTEATGAPDEWAQVFLAQQLDLLVIFVGEALTLRLAQDIWPRVNLRLSLNSQSVAAEVTK